jgi:uncharacterized membrane protein
MKSRVKSLLLGLLLFAGVAAAVHEATILLAPRLLMWAAMRKLEHLAHGYNRILHGPRVDERRHEVVMPSPDLLYSDCVYDLGRGPLRVSAEIPRGTYWSLSAYAERTDNFYTVDDRTAGSTRIALVLATEGQPLPASAAGLPVVRSPSQRGVLLFRTLIDDEAHFAEIDRARRSADCAPLDTR